MSTIRIEKISEVYIRIMSDESTERELSEEFTFEVPGAKFMPKYKARLWDGLLRMYSLQKKTLYAGLLGHVLKFAEENGHVVEYVSNSFYKTPSKKNDLDFEELSQWIDSLKITKDGELIEPHDYQYNAVYESLTNMRLTVISPTASGKSLIIYCMVRWMLEHDIKVVLVVPTVALVTQMFNDFKDYSSSTDWDVGEHCQMLYSGLDKSIKKPVLITTWQSLTSVSKSSDQGTVNYLKRYGCIIGDEAHEWKAKSLTDLLECMVMTPYRIGTTGTLDDSKVNKLVLEGLFGPTYQVVSTKELMDRGSLSDLEIYPTLLKYSEKTKKECKELDYQKEIDFLVTNENRNKIIRNLAIKCTGTTLVLFQFVEKHGKVLEKMIKEKAGERPVYIIHGGVSPDDRERIRTNLRIDKDAIIVASFQTYSRGINVPSIENIILASPTKSKVRILQSIGRGLRLNKGKVRCNLFDIGDDLSINKHKNHSLRHFIDRMKLYISEQFKYKLMQVEIKD